MKYFVSIENIEYFRWQTELLIESFNLLGLQDDLVIGVADSPDWGKKYFRNLNAHKNKFLHENMGNKFGVTTINKPLALCIAIKSNLIDEDFTVIHPDMILYKPITPTGFNITFYPDDSVEDPTVKVIRQSARMPDWLGKMGQTMIFNSDVPYEFFHLVVQQMKELSDQWGRQWDIQKAAWMKAAQVFLFSNKFQLKAEYSLEMTMLHHNPNANLIHYRHGIPNVFNKRHYKSNIILGESKNPLEGIVSTNPTASTNFIKSVVTSYQLPPTGATAQMAEDIKTVMGL